MTEKAHLKCPYTDCGSSDAFSFNSEKGVGKCHSCGRGYPSRHATEDWAKTEYPTIQNEESYEVTEAKIQTGKFLECRGITIPTMEKFGIVTGIVDNKPVAHKYVYPSGGEKLRRFPKSFSAANGFRGDELFGMNLFPAGKAKTLTITEGELDAASGWQMLYNAKYDNPVVSLPSATPSRALWTNCFEWLNSFEKIVLSLDNDEPGNEVADKIGKLFPNKVYRMQHNDLKDANDFLQAGRQRDYVDLWWKAVKYTPANVLNTTEQFMDLYHDSPEHVYVPTGIQSLDDMILGLMQGHFTVIKAPTGIGKTEMLRYIEHSMLKQGVSIAAWHLEETKLRTLLGLASYELQRNVTRKDIIEEEGLEKEVEAAIIELTKDEKFFQFYLGDGQGAEELIDQIRFFRNACGCQFVFFEPIQDVIAGQSETSKEQLLADLSVRLSKLAAELNVGIVTIAHTNDDGDIKYCRMIGQRASVIIDLKRDKESEDLEERNTTHMTVEKNRPCSLEGPAGALRFNPATFTLRER